jgi:hypothetical protein
MMDPFDEVENYVNLCANLYQELEKLRRKEYSDRVWSSVFITRMKEIIKKQKNPHGACLQFIVEVCKWTED